MMALLTHLKKNQKQSYVIIFDDLKRLGRDTRYYLELRDIISALGADVECLNFVFDDSPEGEFHEEIIAATGKLERRQIARQTKQKTKARLEAGYYAFLSPVGYKFVKTRDRGKVLMRDDPAASILAEVMEGFASGRFHTTAEVRHFLEASPDFPKWQSGKIGNDRAKNILTNPLYAGYVEYKPWGVELRKGQHEGLISYETFCRIQNRLKEGAYAPTRQDLNRHFPLRGSVICECGNQLTSGLSRSKTGRYYPYYYCQNRKRCKHAGKSIRKADLEGEFEVLLKQLTPSEGLITTASKMFKKLWDHRIDAQQARRGVLNREAAKIDRKIEAVLDHMMDAGSSTVRKGLERRVEQLENKKLVIEEKVAKCGQPTRPFYDMYRTSIQFLSNPHKIWTEGQYEEKRVVLKLVLTERITYVRGRGYRTPNFSLPFNMLGTTLGREKEMVPRRGLEPPRP